MRIIGGRYSKRIIHPPKNLPVRPTTDLAKESLFNILNNKIQFDGKSALDLFAGTGAISFELASRGCSTVIGVDRNYKCIRFIKETAEKFDMQAVQTLRSDAFRYINGCKKSFDIIFADPPYDLENIPEISMAIFRNNLLNADGWLVIEHPKTVDLSGQDYFIEHRRYGYVNFSFFSQTGEGKN